MHVNSHGQIYIATMYISRSLFFQFWPSIASSCVYVICMYSVYIYSPIHIIHTTQELTERMQQMQKERERQEEMVRRLKQQHQNEVDELKAKVRSAEDTERRWKANNQAVLVRKEAEVKHSKEKLDNALQEIGTLQVSACKYTWSDLHSYNVLK